SHRVLKTEGNLNNLIGTPMTLLGLGPAHERAVVEMGMNTPGEIARMTWMVEPAAGVITNVGPAHIGRLGSMEAIAAAKGELCRGLDPDRAVAVVKLDDPFVAGAVQGGLRKRTFGKDARADVRLLDTVPEGEGQRARYAIDGERVELLVPFAGAHN